MVLMTPSFDEDAQSKRTFCAASYDHVERCGYLFAVGNSNRQYAVMLHCGSMKRLR